MAFCNKALALAIVHGKGYYDEFITWPFVISIFLWYKPDLTILRRLLYYYYTG